MPMITPKSGWVTCPDCDEKFNAGNKIEFEYHKHKGKIELDVQITVKTLKQEHYPIKIWDLCRVPELKYLIVQQVPELGPIEDLRLVFFGHEVKGEELVSAWGIDEGQTIHAIKKPKSPTYARGVNSQSTSVWGKIGNFIYNNYLGPQHSTYSTNYSYTSSTDYSYSSSGGSSATGPLPPESGGSSAAGPLPTKHSYSRSQESVYMSLGSPTYTPEQPVQHQYNGYKKQKKKRVWTNSDSSVWDSDPSRLNSNYYPPRVTTTTGSTNANLPQNTNQSTNLPRSTNTSSNTNLDDKTDNLARLRELNKHHYDRKRIREAQKKKRLSPLGAQSASADERQRYTDPTPAQIEELGEVQDSQNFDEWSYLT